MLKSKRDKEPYVKLDWAMLDSAAWTSLSDRAVWLYIELKRQFRFKDGGDSRLKLPYSRVKWRMSRDSFVKGMKELERYGFINRIEPGGLPKRPTVYALSTAWKQRSRDIVDKEGREAIRLGMARKRTSKDSLKNLIGHRAWEKE